MGGGSKETKQNRYCMQRTKKGLGRIFPAFIILLISAACGVTFAVRLRSDKTDWGYTDYFALAVSAILAAGALVLGVYEIYNGIKDALFL